MTTRFLPGIGRAEYEPVEDQLARDLIAAGHHDEVRFLHDLKVTFDARPNPDVVPHFTAASWQREHDRIADGVGVQEAML